MLRSYFHVEEYLYPQSQFCDSTSARVESSLIDVTAQTTEIFLRIRTEFIF